VEFEFPPMKFDIRIPLPRSFMISGTERLPGGMTRFEGPPAVGSQPSLRGIWNKDFVFGADVIGEFPEV
jgi:hypothetical protein